MLWKAPHINGFEAIKSRLSACLGQPYYGDDNCIIFNTDTVKSQSHLASAMFDLVITSPPYNIGKEYESVMPLDNYVEWVSTWAVDVSRLLSAHGAFLLNLGYVPIESKGRAVPLPVAN